MDKQKRAVSHLSHGMGDSGGDTHPNNIARDGARKRVTPIAYHDGMTPLQQNAAAIGGMGHATATIDDGAQSIAASSAAAPLAHAYGGAPDLKSGKAVAPVPGQRSRTNEDCESHADKCQHGRDMLAGAVKGGSTELKR